MTDKQTAANMTLRALLRLKGEVASMTTADIGREQQKTRAVSQAVSDRVKAQFEKLTEPIIARLKKLTKVDQGDGEVQEGGTANVPPEIENEESQDE